jgi:hypothetical protein
MQVRMFLVLVLFDVGIVVNQVLSDGKEAPDVVELEAGIQKVWSRFVVLIFVVPEVEPGVKVAELDDEEAVGEDDIPQILPVKFQSACSDFLA